jgi:hypothetical protein
MGMPIQCVLPMPNTPETGCATMLRDCLTLSSHEGFWNFAGERRKTDNCSNHFSLCSVKRFGKPRMRRPTGAADVHDWGHTSVQQTGTATISQLCCVLRCTISKENSPYAAPCVLPACRCAAVVLQSMTQCSELRNERPSECVSSFLA